MIRKRWIVAAVTLAAMLSTWSALADQPSATSASDGESLGRVHLAISCSPEAQTEFNRALEEFEASLNAARNRLRGLDGAARAAEAAGKADKARAYYAQIVTLTREMDSKRPEIPRAKSFLGSR